MREVPCHLATPAKVLVEGFEPPLNFTGRKPAALARLS